MPLNVIESRIETLTQEVDHLRTSRTQADSKQTDLLLKMTEIQLNLATQDKTLIKLESALNGNGKPGVLTRLDRVENITAGMVKTLWVLVTAVVAGTVRVILERFK